jgi:hypothetical protein
MNKPEQRPKHLIWFELLYGGSLLISLGAIATLWGAIPKIPIILGPLSVATLLPPLLALGASRWRSNAARWTLTVWTIGSSAVAANGLQNRTDGEALFLAGSTILSLLAVALLFTRPARHWFAGNQASSSMSQ